LRLFFAIFDIFDNFLRLEKLAQTSYEEFFVFNIKTVNFRLKLAVFNSYFFLRFSYSVFFLLKRCARAVASPTQLVVGGKALKILGGAKYLSSFLKFEVKNKCKSAEKAKA